MTTAHDHLAALVSRLSTSNTTVPSWDGELGSALFVGSGDSLSACLLAEAFGHKALSAGDVAWTGSVPPRIDTVVGVSQSGGSVATVAAVEIARQAGIRTIAITARPDSRLALACDEVTTVSALDMPETLPASGYLVLALGVLRLVGTDVVAGLTGIGGTLESIAAADKTADSLPLERPEAISILTLPDMRSAGDFWALKLIEGTGVAVRSIALEESGHVDYFIGPQIHLTLQLIGDAGRARHTRLAEALFGNGHSVVSFDATELAPAAGHWQRVLALAAFGAYVAQAAAERWDRAPFRNGEVPMDAKHIQVDA